MKNKNLVCSFGELLLRMAPYPSFIENQKLNFFIGGAELNVLRALSLWNVETKFVSALPDNYLSRHIVDFLAKDKIDLEHIHFSGSRIGTYYLPIGSELKNIGVIYDRNNSSFSELKPNMINWKEIFKNCSWFHFSAITPALNYNLAQVCKEALAIANEMKLTISVDLNYREKLWRYGKKPIDIMPELVQYCQVVMGNIWSLKSLLDIKTHIEIGSSVGKSYENLFDISNSVVDEFKKQYTKSEIVALTFRLEDRYWAFMRNNTRNYVSKKHSTINIIDKVGSGDCFMAGIVYGLLHKQNPSEIINYATSAAVGKLFEAGDSTKQTEDQIVKRLQS